MDADYDRLLTWLREQNSVLVAFSGGVDSSLLLRAARDALGGNTLAVTARSALHPASELVAAERLAATLGARHRVVDHDLLSLSEVRDNSPERCFHCKRAIFSELLRIARGETMACVVEGSNADDLDDHRPGLRAIRELGVRSPYLELGWGKQTIRRLARERGLPNFDRPSAACLASRIPYGQPLSERRLRRVEQAEQALSDLGFGAVRVRDHGSIGLVEIPLADFASLRENGVRERVIALLRQAGYAYAALDLKGLRSGSLNEVLDRGS